MSIDKIIGLMATTRGFTFKLIADLYGGPRFENQDFFCSKQAQHRPEDEEAVSATLYSLCKRDVIVSVNEAIQEYVAITGNQPASYPAILYAAAPAEPVPVPTNLVVMPAPAPEQPAEPVSIETSQTPPEQDVQAAVTDNAGEYVVAEKLPTPEQTPAQAAPFTGTKAETPQPLHKVIAERLKALGVTKPEMTEWTNFYFKFPDGKLTQDQYIESFTKAEDWIKANSIEGFRAGLEESKQARGKARQPAPAEATTQTSVTDPFTDDPAVAEAMKQISKKWPSWSRELTRVASLWCADQVKDAAALDAFLISCGIAATTPIGKIESLLAISRHMALSSGAAIMAYSKNSGDPLGMLESDISAAVGQPIRFALELPANAVYDAFTKINAQVKGGKK